MTESESGASPAIQGYWQESRRPLVVLVFLLPLILAYEICLAVVLPSDDGLTINTVEAHKRILQFFELFPRFDLPLSGGLYLGGLLIVVVLLAWHLLARDPWKVRPLVVAGMAAESLVLALPLLVIVKVISGSLPLAAGIDPGAVNGAAELGLWSKMAISIGAGLYEELVFRMLLIAVVHTLLVDLAKLPEHVGMGIAVLLSAAAFTVYHDLSGLAGGELARRAIFYFAAGVYFGVVFITRGFGLVVGAHATYDVLTVLIPAVTGE